MHFQRKIQDAINKRNRAKLTNYEPTLICSNCLGGFLYHWLGLRFMSPFINLYLTNDDFLLALENWNFFINCQIQEDLESDTSYPVGIVKIPAGGIIKIHFLHYKSFQEAIMKWKDRCKRIDQDNIGVILSNWNGNVNILNRFERLPFSHKVVLTDKPYPVYPHSYYIKGYKLNSGRNIWATKTVFGKRYIDQFDYVSFINSLNHRGE